MHAIKDDQIAEVKRLLTDGVDPNAKSESGLTPLFLAVLADNRQIVDALLDHGADPGLGAVNKIPPLAAAAVSGSMECAEVLLERGAPVDAKGDDGQSPLRYAAEMGRTEMADLLLGHGSNPNQYDAKGWTPLHAAAWFGHVPLVKQLIGGGASVDIPDAKQGFTTLMLATDRGHSPVVSQLLAAGANPNVTGPRGTTALILAAHRGHPHLVRLLVSGGAYANASDSAGRTPLIYASARSDRRCVMVLLEFGADMSIEARDGKPPLRAIVPPPVVRRKRAAVGRAWLTRAVFALSNRRMISGLAVGVWAHSGNERAQLFDKLEGALKLIAYHDPRRFGLLSKYIKRVVILVHPHARGSFLAALDACLLDSGFALSQETTVSQLALVIVHEATHARLWHLGFGYTEAERARLERTCTKAELAFARRLAVSERDKLVDQAQRDLEGIRTSSLTDTAMRVGKIKALREADVPSWLTRAFEWWLERRSSRS